MGLLPGVPMAQKHKMRKRVSLHTVFVSLKSGYVVVLGQIEDSERMKLLSTDIFKLASESKKTRFNI